MEVQETGTVSKSSTETEYCAMSDACSEIIWLHGLLSEFGFAPSLTNPLHMDNTSAIQIVANPVFVEHTKHIEVVVTQFIRLLIMKSFLFHTYPLIFRLQMSSPKL
jgi:hypothetical protein